MEIPMTAIARVLSRLMGRDVDTATVETIATVCGAFAFVGILYVSPGLDLSVGFF
jgi:hypothetical protein